MKRASLFAAVAIVLIANGFALAHAWQNRTGRADADITLTEREPPESFDSGDDDSGVTLNLTFSYPRATGVPERPVSWLDEKILREVGFNTTVSPSDPAANEFYGRQQSRRAFVAMEYNGPAWQQWHDFMDGLYKGKRNPSESATRLFAIDASNNDAQLRARHPDRASVIIVPSVINIGVFIAAGRTAYLMGTIGDIPSSIHVPLAFSDGFRRLPKDRSKAKYNVHLRYGAALEPWIVGVEFMPSDPSPGSSQGLAIAPHDPPPNSAPR